MGLPSGLPYQEILQAGIMRQLAACFSIRIEATNARVPALGNVITDTWSSSDGLNLPQAVWDDESPDEDWYLDGKGQPITNPHRLSVELKNNDKDGRPTLPTIQGNMRYGHFSVYKLKVQVKKLGERCPAMNVVIPMWYREAAKFREYVSETKKDMKIAAPNASVYKRSKDKRDFAASTRPLRKLAMANFATKLARLNTIMEAISDDTHVATLRLWRAKGMDATTIQQITRDKGERLATTAEGLMVDMFNNARSSSKALTMLYDVGVVGLYLHEVCNRIFISSIPRSRWQESQPTGRALRITSYQTLLTNSAELVDTRVSNWHYAGVDVQMTIRQATRASQEKPADRYGLNKIGPSFSDDDSGLELEGDSKDAWWEGYIDSTTQIQGGSWVHIGRSIHIAYL
ncbi:hypothetical protein DPV78_004577 [Talaromyces pinophilus]|nr:hypothetical protein DPV78_004577 [Talaromyces pinophilus]